MAEQEAQTPEKHVSLVKIYVNDFSFESPQPLLGRNWSVAFSSASVKREGRAWILEAQSLACLVLDGNILHTKTAL